MRVPFRIIIPSPDGPNNNPYIVERILPKRFTDLIHNVSFNVLVLKHIEWYNSKRIKLSLGAKGSIRYRIDFGLMA